MSHHDNGFLTQIRIAFLQRSTSNICKLLSDLIMMRMGRIKVGLIHGRRSNVLQVIVIALQGCAQPTPDKVVCWLKQSKSVNLCEKCHICGMTLQAIG